MITLSALTLGILILGTGADLQPLRQPVGKVVVGYVQDGHDTPTVAADVDYSKITHLNVAFANPINPSGDLSVSPHLSELVKQAHNSQVKVLISIGGGGESGDSGKRDQYFALMSDPNRAAFVGKLVKYLDDNDLDGLDVDLEGPAIGKDYGALVSDLSKALKPKGKLLTAAVSSGYGGPQIADETLGYFDMVNVMAYDATGPWNPDKPGQHSSMDMAKEATAYWLGRGVAKSKLVLGVPFYGWGFGKAFNEGGYSFSEIVEKYPGSELLDQAGSTIYYNGIPTIQAKVKYVVDQDLAGVMIWSLNHDAKGKFSLLSAIHDALAAK